MLSSLQFRLWLTYALVVGVLLCIVSAGLVIYLLRTPLLDQQAYSRLERIVESLALRKVSITQLDSGGLAAAQRIDALLDVRVLVVQPGGELLIDSRSGEASSIASITPGLLSLPRGVLHDTSGSAWLDVSYRLPGGGYLLLATPRREIRTLLFTSRLRAIFGQELLPPLIRAGALALVLALLMAYWMAHWVTAPLQHMTSAARRVANGEYQKIPLEGPKDVKDLAIAFNDMTDQVQASQQSQKDFVANVSHELKTPLTSIQGFALAILDGTIDAPQGLRDAAQVIYDESGRMYRLVLELLDLARLDSGIASITHAPVDLITLLNGLNVKFKPIAQLAKVSLRFEAGPVPVISGDADRLADAFSNILDNAIKHTPEGGEVVMRMSSDGAQVEVSIADTGPGIPIEHISRIFERFYQIDKSRSGGSDRGIGLGLSIAHRIIQAHAGTISASNQSPHGSIFTVKLPVASPGSDTITT